MLSVFITPCTKPTRIHSASNHAVRCATSAKNLARPTCRETTSRDREVDERAQRRVIVARGVDLVAAEPQERRRDAAHDRAGLVRGMAVVEQVAHHRLRRS